MTDLWINKGSELHIKQAIGIADIQKFVDELKQHQPAYISIQASRISFALIQSLMAYKKAYPVTIDLNDEAYQAIKAIGLQGAFKDEPTTEA